MDAATLKSTLSRMGWNQAQFAKRYGVDADTVNRWCTGKISVPPHVVEYLRVLDLAMQILTPSAAS
jgi:transcriptional regulator with XRE-family HTH domain